MRAVSVPQGMRPQVTSSTTRVADVQAIADAAPRRSRGRVTVRFSPNVPGSSGRPSAPPTRRSRPRRRRRRPDPGPPWCFLEAIRSPARPSGPIATGPRGRPLADARLRSCASRAQLRRRRSARLTLLTCIASQYRAARRWTALHTWPAPRIAAAVRARELSAEEVTRHHLDRIAEHEHLHAVITLTAEAALARARDGAARAAGRRAAAREGHLRHRRRAHDLRLGDLPRPRPGALGHERPAAASTPAPSCSARPICTSSRGA